MAIFVSDPESFIVEEIPAYRPVGEGTHTFVWIEKRGLTTPEAIKRVARGLAVPERDIGYAGLKDRHATTRQFLSLPNVAPETAMAFAGDGLVVLEAARHGNKLRTGHLKGNRFEVVVRVDAGGKEAADLEERLKTLAREGVPNRFGDQRFGSFGDNVAKAIALLRGGRERDQRRRRFLLSSLQSAVFNRALELRLADGGLLKVRVGDVMQKRMTGGLFVCEDPAIETERVQAGEIVPTGPMPGTREIEPPEGTPARVLEDEALAFVGVTRAEIEAQGRALPGARRPVTVPVELGEPPIAAEGADRLRLRFSLPSGSYATVLLDALGVVIERAA